MMMIENIYQHFLKSSGICTDSRKIKKNNIFFALHGENFDGNKYAADALDKGASYVVIDREEYSMGSQYILVEDSLRCLQDLARYHRNQLNIPILAITGTNGKTSSKELIHRVLAKKFNTLATEGNLNNHIGVPLTLLSIDSKTEIAVVEMGANHIGEISLLCDIANPTLGLITNIGKAHLEGFGGYEGVIKAKNELYAYLRDSGGSVFVNIEDAMLLELSSGIRRKTYGSQSKADTIGKILASIPLLEISYNEAIIKTQLYGKYNFQNIMAALATGEFFQVEPKQMSDAISAYTPDNSRSQLLKTQSNTVYLDAYNANPSSMQASIENFEKQPADKKALILGDMLEMGSSSGSEHQHIADMVKGKFETVVLIGPEFMKTGAATGIQRFLTTDEARMWLMQNPMEDCQILVKGSRGIALEKLTDLL